MGLFYPAARSRARPRPGRRCGPTPGHPFVPRPGKIRLTEVGQIGWSHRAISRRHPVPSNDTVNFVLKRKSLTLEYPLLRSACFLRGQTSY